MSTKRSCSAFLPVLAALGLASAFTPQRSPAQAPAAYLPCNGAHEAAALGIEPVEPPAKYALDDDVCPQPDDSEATWQCAADTAAIEALIGGAPAGKTYDIVLDGTYGPDGLAQGFAYLRLRGHRLWARETGSAVLRFGVDAGGNNEAWAGGELHGLVIELADDQHAYRVVQENQEDRTAAVATWGVAGVGVTIEDCVLRGPGVDLAHGVHRGIWAAQTRAFQARRLEIDGFLRFGLIYHDGDEPAHGTHAEIADIRIDDVGDAAWHAIACNPDTPAAHQHCGTQEIGLWIGDPVVVRRVRIRDIAGAGIVTAGDTEGATLEHLDVDFVGLADKEGGSAGIYIERNTRNTTFHRFCIGTRTRWGVKSEWDHNALNPEADVPPPFEARGLFNTLSRGLIESRWVGVNFDQGTVDSSVEGVTIRGYQRAGIAMFRNVATPLDYDGDTLPTLADYLDNVGGSQQNNIFQDADGNPAVDVEDVRCRFTRGHVSTPPLPCEPP